MLGFVFLVLIIGALLILLSPLIYGFLTSPSHPSSSGRFAPSYSSSPAYSAPAYSNQSYGATTAAQAQTGGDTPAPAPAQAAAPSGPLIGIALEAVPYQTAQFLNRKCNLPVGVGCLLDGVRPGSPASAAGLAVGDVLASMSSQGQAAEWITPRNQLSDFLVRHGAGVPVTLHVYRIAERRDFFVSATPQ